MSNEERWFDRSFDSLEQLADTIGEALSCPVTIEDASHRLLAYSSHTPSTDPARIATIISRRVPENVISSLWREGMIAKLMESDEPIRIPAINEVGLGDRVAISIRMNGSVLGYIWVLEENKKLDKSGMNQLKKAAVAARTKLLQHQNQRRKEQENRQDFFWQLLTGHLKSGSEVLEKADRVGIALPSGYYIVIVQLDREVQDRMLGQIHYALPATGRVRFPLYTTQRNQLILLAEYKVGKFSGKDNKEGLNHFLQTLKDRFELEELAVGCGTVSGDYGLLEQNYKEAQSVLQIKKQFPKQLESALYYDELGFYRLLPLSHEHNMKHSYSNPKLERLKAYDREHNGSLVETLEVFLSLDSNVKDASDALHIHANSLNYRLKRISEIGDIDLSSMDQKVTLYMDLKIEKHGSRHT